MHKLCSFIATICIGLWGCGSVWALSAIQPAAIVNNEVITIFDLQQRIELTLMQTQSQRTAQARKNIAQTVLETQILERLRLAEAESLSVLPTKYEVEAAIRDFEVENGLAAGGAKQVLRQQNIDYQSFYENFRTSIAWQNIVQNHVMPLIEVTDAEVEREVERQKNALKNRDLTEVRMMMLVLTHQAQTPEQAHNALLQLRQNVLAGAKFSELARQFSADVTAQVGGDLGWVAVNNFMPEAQLWLASARRNDVSTPINLGDASALFQLRDRRKASAKTIDAEAIRLQIGNSKLQTRMRALERDMRKKAIIKIFVAL